MQSLHATGKTAARSSINAAPPPDAPIDSMCRWYLDENYHDITMTQLNEESEQQDNKSTTTSEDLSNLSTDEVDVVIIGAGPAG